jgi:hypothetical protein
LARKTTAPHDVLLLRCLCCARKLCCRNSPNTCDEVPKRIWVSR